MITSSKDEAIYYAGTFVCVTCDSMTVRDTEPHVFAISETGVHSAWRVRVLHERGCPLDPETIHASENE